MPKAKKGAREKLKRRCLRPTSHASLGIGRAGQSGMLRFSSRQAPPTYQSVLRYPGLPLLLKLQCNLRDPGLPTQEFCVDGLTFAAGLHLCSCRL